MKELTIALLMWISSHTPLTYDSSNVPDVLFVPQDKLVEILYQGNVPQGLDVDSVSVAGLYNYKDGNIYLLDDIDVSTIEGKAVLLHELVHYLQYQHGVDKSVACMRKLERSAYDAQAKYLQEHGKSPNFNELHVMLVSTCWPMD